MHGKYFQAVVKPTIAASAQHVAFSNRDVLFDWTPIEIPKGTAKLVSVVAFVRPNPDAGPTQGFAPSFPLWFADDDRTSFGTSNSAQSNRPHVRDLIGCLEISTENHISMGSNSSIATFVSGPTLDGDHGKFDSLVFTPNHDLAEVTAGHGTIYFAAITGGHVFGETLIRINDGDIDTSSPGTTLVTDGTGMDVREHFEAGDILHAHDDAVIGTIASVDSATNITLTESISTGVLEDDDYVYNIHPIKFVFNFEY